MTHSVEPYAVVVGSPARPLRKRFDEETIDALEQSKWWELSPERLMEFYGLMDKPAAFARAVIEARRHG